MNTQVTKSPNTGKKKNGFISFLTQRKFRYGGLAIAMTAVIIAVVILLNVAIGALEQSRALTIDLSAMRATDFDDVTYEVIDRVDKDVTIYTVYQGSTANSLRVQIDNVLAKYHALNGHINVGNIDPVAEPTRINKFSSENNLQEGSVIVTNADETRFKVIPRDDFYGNTSYGSYSWSYFRLESYLTSALVYVTSEESPNVYFLTGHGEMDHTKYFTVLTQQLQNHNYEVSSLSLTDGGKELKSGDTVVVVDPARDLNDAEYETLRTWLSDGGRMLVSMTYSIDMTTLPNFTRLLDYYQLSYGDGVISENENATSNYWNGSPISLIPVLDAEHEITADLASANRSLIVPQARPINNVDLPESGVRYTKLLTTSNRAVVNSPSGDVSEPGTQTVALAMLQANMNDSTKDTRIVLLGSVYLMADSDFLFYSYNGEFIVNVFDWLVNSDSTVEVSSKFISASDTLLAIPDMTTAWIIAGIVVGLIPLAVLVVGLIVWNKRRRL